MHSPAETTVEALSLASFKRPKLVIAVWSVVLLVSSLGIRQISLETNTESVLDHHSEPWRFYQRSQDLFGVDEGVTIAIHADSSFAQDSLALTSRLTTEIESLSGVRRVDSLSTVPIVETTVDGDVILAPVLLGVAIPTAAEAKQIGRRALANRIIPNVLASADGKVLALNVLLDSNGANSPDALLEALYRIAPADRTWVSGVPVFRVETDSRTRSELALFIPVTVVAIGVLLFAIFRSIAATMLPLVSASCGTAVVTGVMGTLAVPLTISTVILPSVFLAMGCAYSIHLLIEAAGARDEAEISAASIRVARPLALSGLTTAIGFAAVAVVPIDALRQLGGFGALGTFTVVASSLTLGPAFLSLWSPGKISTAFVGWARSTLHRALVGVAIRNPRSVVTIWAVIAIICAFGVSRVRIETDVTQWFPTGGVVRDSYDNIRASLSGISPMNVVVAGTAPDAMLDPQTIAAIDRLAEALRRQNDVGKVVSIADPLRELHGKLAADVQQPLPNTRELIAQYLVLLETKEQFRDLVTSDRSTANVMLRVNNNGSEHLLSVARFAESWWKEHGLPEVSIRTTGIMFEFARAQRAIAIGQLQGLALDFLTIAAILFAIFRLPRVAIVALIPNALPLVLIFGAMGFLHVPLDAGTVVVGNLALGIAVDETVFILSAYMLGRSDRSSSLDAISDSVRHVLPALVATTGAVAIGFAVLASSGFAFTQKLGVLTAAVMLVCVAANVTLLPALLTFVGLPEAREKAARSAYG